MSNSQISERNQAEIERSASEASKVVLQPIAREQVARYLNPPADTAFALEYAFHLLGDVRGKTVLDLGCGTGENVVLLLERGARVIGMDISPDLIDLAQRRVKETGREAALSTGDAYATGLPDASVDAIFCIALIHHLDIKRVRDEMRRIVKPGGVIILSEPIRFSKGYGWMRGLLPAQADISDYEHPLTREELAAMMEGITVEGTRYFRLPFVPLISKIIPAMGDAARRVSNWMLRRGGGQFASIVATRLRRQITDRK